VACDIGRSRKGLSIAFSALAILSCLSRSASADPGCHLSRVTTAPITVEPSGQISIPLTIGSMPEKFVVDTASGVSMIAGEIVDTLSLTRSHVSGHVMLSRGRVSFSGLFGSPDSTATDSYVVLQNVQIGTYKPAGMDLFVAPNGWFKSPYSGIIGSDVLHKFDAEFDFGNASFSLFLQDHCPGEVVYWTREPAARLQFETNLNHQIVIPVELDGRSMHAVIDTATQRNAAPFERLAGDFGIDGKNPAVTSTAAADGRGYIYQYPFKTLSFDGITIQNPKIALVPTLLHRLSNGPDVLTLGTDTLKQLHLYIAYGESYVYVTSASAH
jgi:hypothetical protein